MTRGDGTTFDTDAHVEWGFIVDDWPAEGVTSFMALENEEKARQYVGYSDHPASIYGKRLRRLAKRTIGHAEEVE